MTVDLTVINGECVAVLGDNGSGKSTLFAAIAGLLTCSKGSIHINDRVVDTAENPRTWIPPEERRVGFLPQGGALFPHLTGLENVAFGLRARGESTQHSRSVAMDMLTQFGMETLAHRRPHQLSGGQRQRVALARTLILQPDVLLLDEPTVALDRSGRDEVMTVLTSVRTRFNGPILFASHDERDIDLLATQTVAITTSFNGDSTVSSLTNKL